MAKKTKRRSHNARGATRLGRRHLLRGLAGTAVALPLLECMLPDERARAADTCRRFLLTSAGFSLNVDGAPGSQTLVPTRTGPGYDVGSMLSPINLHGLGNEITVVSGMDLPHGSGPGARAPGDSFHFHSNPMFCGVTQVGELDATVTGTTSDQLVADVIGNETLFKHLNYRVQARYYNTGGGAADRAQNRDTLSFRANASGPATPISAEFSPEQAYNTLFTSFTPDDPALAARRAAELRRRRSVLDYVDRNIQRRLPRMSRWDQRRLEQHYDEIRSLESLLSASMPTTMNASCQMLPPFTDPPLGGDFNAPFAWNTSDGYSNEDLRADMFNQLMRMAFVCDLTRVGTLMYTMFQSFMNTHPIVGASFNVHALNHMGTQSQHEIMVQWHVRKFADLVASLRDTPEADGSLLDNCAVALMIEGGARSGTTQVPGGHSHTTANMGCLLAGGAGGLRRGEHIPTAGAHPAQVLLSMMQAVGAPQPALGEVQGALPALFL